MTDTTSLGDRMKRYELAVGDWLIPRTPTIIRVDGKAFHTFTRRLTANVDPTCASGPSLRMHNVMMATSEMMCRQIQNCVLAYTQSDEISFFLRDWDDLQTQQWFGGKVQKIVSVSAAMAAAYFNHFWRHEWMYSHPEMIPTHPETIPLFDARTFNLPKEELTNYFIWRQQDATHNSINFIARLYFSHKQLQGKNVPEVMDLLHHEKGINWNDVDTWKKRGSCIVNNMQDDEIPIFRLDRNYTEKHLHLEE